MPPPQEIRVKEMPRASLLEDGTYVEMEFKGHEGERVTLGFDPDRLLAFVSQVNQLTHEARIRKAASAGHLEVLPLPVVATNAQEAVGGKAVILSFRTGNGQIYAFAASPDEASTLRKHMMTAIDAARKQSKQTRQ